MNTKQEKLANERENSAWSPRALRINGWRYSGILDADLVARAVCSGFINQPEECQQLLKPRDPFVQQLPPRDDKNTVSYGTVFAVLAASAVCGAVVMLCYRR